MTSIKTLMRMRFTTRVACLSLAALLILALQPYVIGEAPSPKPTAVPSEDQAIEFNRDIRPILSDRCFQCHGPDGESREADLRLDSLEGATAELSEGGVAVLPGKPHGSVMLERMRSADEDMRMPPPDSNMKLTKKEIDLVERWIKQGAEYQQHWSFVPLPASVPVPKNTDSSWSRSTLDRFVAARLEKEKLSPSPETTRPGWLRRVTLDLTGLPPTPDEIEAFLQDKSPEAYETVVDRLLASPHFGEHLAAPWLDAARYADSYGYQSDKLSPTWPYRDWVIRSLNNNLPYDQFITWQVAGDLLPDASREQILATAFNRLHRMTNEGGSIPEEFRAEYVADRVQTLGSAVLGLTFECARCHDHRFDPISQREFYSMSAFFNNIDEWGTYLGGHIVPTPSMLLPTDQQELELNKKKKTIAQCEAKLRQAIAESEDDYKKWLQISDLTPTIPGLTSHFPLDSKQENKLVNLTDKKAPGTTTVANQLIDAQIEKGLLLLGDEPVTLPGQGNHIQAEKPFTLSMWLRFPAKVLNGIICHTSTGSDAGYHGTEITLKEGRLAFSIVRFWPGNAIAIQTPKPVTTDQWTHVAISYDGSTTASGMNIYLDGQPTSEVVRDNLYKSPQQHTKDIVFGQRFRALALKNFGADEVRVYNRCLTQLEIENLSGAKSLTQALTKRDPKDPALVEYYQSNFNPEISAARESLQKARADLLAFQTTLQETMIMQEMPEPRQTHLLARGLYDAPKTDDTRVAPATPEVLGPIPEDAPKNRLTLARWLVQEDHPLTARVQVNRIWQGMFGAGLVETSENFGVQGAPPSHPMLLDWLARDFIASGWDVKRLCKQIALSATYRQSSSCEPALRARDPQNRLLARGPSHRLTAEAIRDTALAASGLLNRKMGGPPVSPYQPPNLWRESNSMSPTYHQSVGKALYRRSSYSVLKRTAPLPNMLAFDGLTREVCTMRRQSTNTPIQALVLLNDIQFIEASRALGEKMLLEGGKDDPEKVRFAFLRLASREPTKQETAILVELFQEQRALFKSQPDEAKKLIAIGEHPASADLAPEELAAATVVAQAILNLDATVWKR